MQTARLPHSASCSLWIGFLRALTIAILAAATRAATSDPQRSPKPSEYVASGPVHRMTVAPDSRALARLRSAGAISWSEEYGSYVLAGVDERLSGSVTALRIGGLQLRDYLTLVDFNGYRLDGAEPERTSAMLANLPELLRAPRTSLAQGESALKIIQFVGPTKNAWYDALQATGAFIITYAAQDSYVVKVDAAASAALDALAKRDFVLALWNYEPAFKLRPALRPPTLVDTQIYDVNVQALRDDRGQAFVESLRSRAFAVLEEPQTLDNYIDIGLQLDGANVIDLACDPRVFAIEPRLQPTLDDERQDQIVAGKLNPAGDQPSGPSYLAWLASQGFSGTNQFDDFVVDVSDSGLDRGVTGAMERSSVPSNGSPGQGGGGSGVGCSPISSDGRYVAFSSGATDLVTGDTNGRADVFVRDRQVGTTERVSLADIDLGGGQASNDCSQVSMSADGRYVAFASFSQNLVPPPNSLIFHVYVHDRQTHHTRRISADANGNQGNLASGNPSVSPDGGYVAFQTGATNFGVVDTNGVADVFIHSTGPGNSSPTAISLVPDGSSTGNGSSYFPSISNGGQFVAFQSTATNLTADANGAALDVFLRDTNSQTTTLISIGNGQQGGQGCAISADGRFVAFHSSAQLVASDMNAFEDAYVYDRVSTMLQCVSVGCGGASGDNTSCWESPAISSDGRFVAFTSRASNLVIDGAIPTPARGVYVRDRLNNVTSRVSTAYVYAGLPNTVAILAAGDGPVCTLATTDALETSDTNGFTDVYVVTGYPAEVNKDFKKDGLENGASRIAYEISYVTAEPLPEDLHGHGTLCASIVAGYNATSGIHVSEDADGYQYGLGVAPWARVGISKIQNGSGAYTYDTVARLEYAYRAGARISSNSWGIGSGVGTSIYDQESQRHDRGVRDADLTTSGNQEMVIVFSAGNDGTLGANTVHPPGSAKNVITVGASEGWRLPEGSGCGPDMDSDKATDLAALSSRGATNDGRKKPDILAPGTLIQGLASSACDNSSNQVCRRYWPDTQSTYTVANGTSFSAPAVAGACALLRQWFKNHGRPEPSPALTKALLIAGATYMTGSGAGDSLWSNNQGMGRINLQATFNAIPPGDQLVDQSVVFADSSDSPYTWSGILPRTRSGGGSRGLRVVLVWTDPPGLLSGDPYVNNLDLEVRVDGVLYLGNDFSGATSTVGGVPDYKNNVESVFLPPGTSGHITVTVLPFAIDGDGVPDPGNTDVSDQDFALVISGVNLKKK